MSWMWTDPLGRKLSLTLLGIALCWAAVWRHRVMDRRKTEWKAAIPHSKDPANCRLNASQCGLLAGMYMMGTLAVLLALIVMWIWF